MKHTILEGDVLDCVKVIPSGSVDMVFTSPPYWGLRDYGVDGQWGLESHPQEYINNMVLLGRELKRVLKDSGSFWLNLGDTYCTIRPQGHDTNSKHKDNLNPKRSRRSGLVLHQKSNWLQPKQLLLLPSRVAVALQEDGWVLRNDVIWHKPNPMPSSVRDRFSNTFEHLFLFVKNRKYFFDLDAVRVPHKEESIRRACRGRHSKKLDEGQYAVSYKEDYKGYDDMQGKLERGELRGAHPQGKNPGDTMEVMQEKKRKSWYSNPGHDKTHVRKWKKGADGSDFFEITTQSYKEAHFAVFPEKLVDQPLLAGCPREVCVECGKPREKIVESEPSNWRERKDTREEVTKHFNSKGSGGNPGGGFIPTKKETVGWSDCGCGKGFEPGVVLDPFAGSGTVAKVALEQKKSSISIELNPEYVKLIKKRLRWKLQRLGGVEFVHKNCGG